MDETGCNTGGRNDKNNASEKLVCPTGVTPKQEVGIKDEHFTVLPVTNLAGVLVLIVIIFKGERLLESWCFSLDVFTEERVSGQARDILDVKAAQLETRKSLATSPALPMPMPQ
jgi:hypothetical protein